MLLLYALWWSLLLLLLFIVIYVLLCCLLSKLSTFPLHIASCVASVIDSILFDQMKTMPFAITFPTHTFVVVYHDVTTEGTFVAHRHNRTFIIVKCRDQLSTDVFSYSICQAASKIIDFCFMLSFWLVWLVSLTTKPTNVGSFKQSMAFNMCNPNKIQVLHHQLDCCTVCSPITHHLRQ